MPDSTDPPAKRQKISHQPHPQQSKKQRHNKFQYHAQPKLNGKSGNARHGTRQISATGILSGDVGILVTSDKGKEKRALREVEGLVEGFWEGFGVTGEGGDGRAVGGENGAAGVKWAEEDGTEGVVRVGEAGVEGAVNVRESIEDDVEAELRELRGEKGLSNGNRGDDGSAFTSTGPKLGLVMLDIPCVSFLRVTPPREQPQTAPADPAGTNEIMTPGDPYDPVSIVYAICQSAYKHPLRQKSRFVKRLTPITRWRKILAHSITESKDADEAIPAESMRGLTGLERLCLEALPPVFAPENCPIENDEGLRKGWKYAIRVTVRNNDKIGRDNVIKSVAGYVVSIGRGKGHEGGEEGDQGEEGDGEGRKRRNSSSEVEDGPGRDALAKDDGATQKAVEEELKTEKSQVDHVVSLKAYEKLIMVDIYRNVVGMSVVGKASEFEDELRRFNLAEIYAEGRKRIDAKDQDAKLTLES
jgi:hypothetical protein